MSLPPRTSCPTDAELSDWIQGLDPSGHWADLTEHIESCARCERKLESISSESDAIHNELLIAASDRDRTGFDSRNRFVDNSVSGTPQNLREKPFANASSSSLVGENLDNYEILSLLGQGGMGTVYKARNVSVQKIVALKVLPPHSLSPQGAVERFKREMVATGTLDHPNIVGAHDGGEVEGIHYLVMEFVDGEDLATLVRRDGPLGPQFACEVIRQAAIGLEHAHDKGLIHRDVKPSNLMLASGDKPLVKVLDLGLARVHGQLAEPDAGDLTSTGQVMGTVDYMSPEQAVNIRDADERSDIYSLGMTLFFLLTGRPAFQGETPMERLLAHREKPIPVLREIESSVPESLQDLFQRMVAKAKNDRPESMRSVITEIGHVIDEFSGTLQPAGSRSAVNDSVATARIESQETLNETTSKFGTNLEEDAPDLAHWRIRPRSLVLFSGIVGLISLVFSFEFLSGSSEFLSWGRKHSIGAHGDGGFRHDQQDDSIDDQQDDSIDDVATEPPSEPPVVSGDWKPGDAEEGLPGLVALPAEFDGISRWQIETEAPRSRVRCVAFSPDDELIALGTEGGYARIIDARTLDLRVLCPGWKLSQISAMSWSPDGRLLTTGGATGSIRIWSRDGRLIRELDASTDYVHALAWSPDGELIAASGDGGLIQMFNPNGDSVGEFQTDMHGILQLAWKPKARILAAVSTPSDRKCLILDMTEPENCRKVDQIAMDYPGSLDWTSDGSRLALADGDSLLVWSEESGIEVVKSRKRWGLAHVAWSGDNSHIIAGRLLFASPQILSASGSELLTLSMASKAVCDWSHDGTRIVVADAEGMIQLWDSNGKLISSRQRSGWHGNVLSWSVDGQYLAAGTQGSKLNPPSALVWRADGVQTASNLSDGGAIADISWHPDGNLIASANLAEIHVWSPNGSTRFTIPGRSMVAWSPLGRKLASFTVFSNRSGQGINIWSTDGKLIDSLHSNLIDTKRKSYSLSWSPDGSTLAFLATSGRVGLWSPGSGEPRELPLLPSSSHFLKILWSPKSDWLLATIRGTNRTMLMRPDGTAGPVLAGGDYAHAASWSNDGTRIAIGSHKRTRFRIWTIEGPTQRLVWTPIRKVGAIDWSRTDQIAVANLTRQICVLNAESGMPQWTAVILGEGRSLTFSAAGQIISSGDVDVESKLIYLIERDDGALQVMKPSEFQKRTGVRIRSSLDQEKSASETTL